MKKLNALLIAMLVTGAAFAQATWTADKVHSKIGFNASHLVVSEVEGSFKDYDVKVTSTSDDFNGADIEFTARVASISTDNEKRDNHLKSDDFFNAEKYPELKFKGKLTKEGGKYVMKGDLTIRDVTKAVSFDVVYGGSVKAFGGTRAGFKLSGKIDRFAYNLKWDKAIEAGGLVVGKEIEIVCKVELSKAG
jgi:polyisoprenoid-binding protein YceI